MSRPAQIMIVDDEPNIRLTTRMMLEADGYTVVEAENGEDALERLRGGSADLILLDLRMPLLDGWETLRHLRDIGDGTPVVIITAHGGIPDAVEAMRLGAFDFLEKPTTPEKLRRVVADVLSRSALSHRHLPDSSGATETPTGVSRDEREGMYRVLGDLFPVGKARTRPQ